MTSPDRLPNMRQWAREHFQAPATRTTSTRRPIGIVRPCGIAGSYRDGERTILVSVGGTRAGRHLLTKCAEAFAGVAWRLPTRAWACWWPVARLDPRELAVAPADRGAAVRPQTFTSTTRRSIWPSCRAASPPRWSWRRSRRRSSTSRCAIGPFRAAALRGPPPGAAGRRGQMDYDRTTAEALGAAMVAHLGQPVRYADVPVDGTERAARLIANLL